MRFTALELASLAHLWVSRVPTRGVVRREGTRILVGPHASEDEIATVACRRQLELELGATPTESAVRARVEEHGFRFAAASAAA